jgi:hypothetical protein
MTRVDPWAKPTDPDEDEEDTSDPQFAAERAAVLAALLNTDTDVADADPDPEPQFRLESSDGMVAVIERLRLNPGDTLVANVTAGDFEFHGELSHPLDQLAGHLQSLFPDNPVIVVNADSVTLSVIEKGEDP